MVQVLVLLGMQLSFRLRLLEVLPQGVPTRVVSVLLDLLLQFRVLQDRLEVPLVIQSFRELLVLSFQRGASCRFEGRYGVLHGIRGEHVG